MYVDNIKLYANSNFWSPSRVIDMVSCSIWMELGCKDFHELNAGHNIGTLQIHAMIDRDSYEYLEIWERTNDLKHTPLSEFLLQLK